MSTQDLIAGYAAYTEAAELGHDDGAPAITPTTSSGPCAASVSVSVSVTYEAGC